jgi:hypothetical protein
MIWKKRKAYEFFSGPDCFEEAGLFSMDSRIPFESFIVTFTSSSSPSIDVATTEEVVPPAEKSPSDPLVSTISGSTLSVVLVSASSSSMNSWWVVKVAIFSRTFRFMTSSLRA